jgi:hypothetical protein
MNGQPPKLSEAQSATAPSTNNRLLLGIGVGLLAGLLLATMFWIPVGYLVLRKSSARQMVRVEEARAEQAVARAEQAAAQAGSDQTTLAEIDAAARLSFENNRASLFAQIGARPNLSPDVQVRLVEAIFKHLSFENTKLDLLQKLIANPAFSPAAEQAILSRLNNLSFENNRQVILQAMMQHH